MTESPANAGLSRLTANHSTRSGESRAARGQVGVCPRAARVGGFVRPPARAAGWNVVASVRKALDLSAHGERESVKTLLDVNDEEAGLNFAEHDLEQFGRMDALINAGYFQVGSRE